MNFLSATRTLRFYSQHFGSVIQLCQTGSLFEHFSYSLNFTFSLAVLVTAFYELGM